MSRHFKVFDTHAEYEAFINEGISVWPNISICKDRYDAHFNDNGSITPTGETHEYVEIAGIKWATMNLGATAVTDYGLYYQWGDVEGYTQDQIGDEEGEKYFDWQNYKFSIGESSEAGAFTKYNDTDNLKTLELVDDAVNVEWGGNWRIPTNSEWEALLESTTNAWTNNYQGSNVAGITLTDNEDTSKVLFLPAAGYAENSQVIEFNNGGCYWTSDIAYVSNDVFHIEFNEHYLGDYSRVRYYGYTLRGVLDE